jgi:hypothetical protein
MDMQIDQSWQYELSAQVDQLRARFRCNQPVPNQVDTPTPNDNRLGAARRPVGTIE